MLQLSSSHSGCEHMSKEVTHGELAGPMMVETHSKRLSPLGPAEQLHGGSKLISASSFWILYKEQQEKQKINSRETSPQREN